MTTAHDEKMVTTANLHEYCHHEAVDYEDAILMSNGEAPKNPVKLINAKFNIPYEDFKSGGTY